MKKLIIILLFAGIIYWTYGWITQPSDDDKSLIITNKGTSVEIERGDVKFITQSSPEFTTDLRLFGISKNDNRPDWGQKSVVTHHMVAAPMDIAQEIFNKYLCEKTVIGETALIQVIAQGSDLRNKIDDLEKPQERLCVNIKGKTLTIQKYFYKGEDFDLSRITSTTTDVKSDIWKIILLSDVKEIPCQ